MTDASCVHCGLPVPPRRSSRFCCSGCEAVYSAIHELGLEGFYELRTENDGYGVSGAVSGRSYEEFDDPSFLEVHASRLDDRTRATTLYLEGLHCSACVWLIERLASVIDGALEIRVDLGRSRARVSWSEPARLSEIARRLDSLGYRVHPYREGAAERARRQEDRSLLVRLALCGAVAGNVMLISFALYGGAFDGMEAEYTALFRWASMIVATPAVIWGGGVFFRGAWSALRAGGLHMDLPISIGILAGYGGGCVNTVLARGEVYFDSVTALVFLLLVGRFLERRQRRRAAEATDLLAALAPQRARRIGPEGVQQVPVTVLRPGDLIELRPGDTIPADATVVEGTGAIDQSLLTGESKPIDVVPGEAIYAGTLNLMTVLRARIEQVGENSRVGELMGLVETLTSRRANIVRLADRVSGYFVAVVVLLAGITAVIWIQLDPAHALDHTMALLVVTCPCALGLATPLAVSAALGHAARAGILIKGGEPFEVLRRPGRIWLDKTGTVTEGRMAVVDFTRTASGGLADSKVCGLVSRLESASRHPIARALADREPDEFGDEAPLDGVIETPGAGIEGLVGEYRVQVGSPRWLAERTDLASARPALEAATSRGHSPVVVAIDDRIEGVFELADRVRAGARSALDRLRGRGWSIGILSGDHEEVVAQVARELGVGDGDCRSALTPEEKVAAVESTVEQPVVMVGDGVNDAAAMAAASVGVGMNGGAEATLASCDIFFSRPGLEPLVDIVEGADRTFRVIRRNLLFSLGYNVVGASLAMTGVIGPLVAAILMPISSLTVVLSSYRSRTFRAAHSPETGTPSPMVPRRDLLCR